MLFMKGHMTIRVQAIINIYSLSMLKVTTTAICDLVTLHTPSTYIGLCTAVCVCYVSLSVKNWVTSGFL